VTLRIPVVLLSSDPALPSLHLLSFWLLFSGLVLLLCSTLVCEGFAVG